MNLSTIILICIVLYNAYFSMLVRVALNPTDSDPDLPQADALFGLVTKLMDALGLNPDITWASKTDLKRIATYREEQNHIMEFAVNNLAPPPHFLCVSEVTCTMSNSSIKSTHGLHKIPLFFGQKKRNGGSKPRRLVVYFHPGGGVIGYAKSATFIALVQHMDTFVVSVDYRKAPEHPYPAAINDAFDAVSWAFANAANYVQQSDKIVLAGDSGGAMVAAAVAQRWKDEGRSPRMHQMLLLIPMLGPVLSRSYVKFEHIHLLPLKQMGFFWDMYAPNIYDCVVDPICSPVSASVERLKEIADKVAVIAGRADVLSDEAKEYARKLQLAGVETKYVAKRGTHIGVFLFSEDLRDGGLLKEMDAWGA